MISGCTMFFPMVAATAVPLIAPAMFNAVARASAFPGERTRTWPTWSKTLWGSVPPLTKSAASTSPSTTSRIGVNSIRSRVLQHNAFDHVGHVLALVCGLLHEAIELAPLDDDQRLVGAVKQCCERGPQQPVARVLEPVDFDTVRHDGLAPHAPQVRNHPLHLLQLLLDDLRDLLRLREHLLHLEQDEALRHGFHEIHDIIEVGGQPVDILAVDRRDERLVQPLHDLVGELVGIMLEPFQPLGVLAERIETLRGLHEHTGRLHEPIDLRFEQIKERLFLWNQPKPHSRPRLLFSLHKLAAIPDWLAPCSCPPVPAHTDPAMPNRRNAYQVAMAAGYPRPVSRA